MAGSLALDFGTSNSVAARWDPAAGEGVPIPVPEASRYFLYGSSQTPVVPSYVYYGGDGQTLIGEPARRMQYDQVRCFRDIKHSIANRLDHLRTFDTLSGSRQVSTFGAGHDFIRQLLTGLRVEEDVDDTEIVLSLPVEAFEHFASYLTDAVESAGFRRFRFIDEASAAALGHGSSIRPGEVYMVVDFGGGTLDCSVVMIEDHPDLGRRCRVLGKAGAEVGGGQIDAWIWQHVLAEAGFEADDERLRSFGNLGLVECAAAKERLSSEEKTTLVVMDPSTGSIVVGGELTGSDLERIIERNGGYARLTRTIQRAVEGAVQRGFTSDSIKEVLLVGGSTLIPSIQQRVRDFFGDQRVRCERPIDAVARGAAALAAGVDFFDHIQHSYALRHRDPTTNQYMYETLIPRGTDYPVEKVRTLTIRATFDNQTQMELAIFEISDPTADAGALELVFDPAGAPRLQVVAGDSQRFFYMNEARGTFLSPDPPANRGEPCYSVSFSIDESKRLLVSAVDERSGAMVLRDAPVIRMT